tara:strand:+ start:677 stop:1039 length:363 start_codon:yes stop_codon:yes gene_type:complete
MSVLLLSSCALLKKPPREVTIKTVPIKIKITQPVLPRKIDLKEPQWYVVSEKNLDEFLVSIEKESGTMVFFAMSPGDYELMAYNLQEIKRYVKELKQVVVYYKKVTTIEEKENGNPENTK